MRTDKKKKQKGIKTFENYLHTGKKNIAKSIQN